MEELARIARSSRSAYADRFTREMGMPPGRYLVAWRMHRARELMRGTDLSLAQVAERVGYASETGFHRAFKRLFGETPAAWRASRRSAASGSGAEPDESPLP